MTSRPDEAGPSGLAPDDIIRLLGLEISDSEKEEEEEETAANSSDLLCQEEMGDNEEDDVCQDVLDRFERQRAFQSELLEQSGGCLGGNL